MNRGEGFKAMNAKDIVLPKRDLDYKVKLVSNDDWLKKVWIFLVLSARENPQTLNSPPLLSRILFAVCFLELFLFPYYVALRWIFAFLLMPFLVLFRVSLAVFCLSQRPFLLLCAFLSTGFTPFTSCFLWSLCLFLSSLLSLKTLFLRTWIITVSPGWQSFSTM